MSWLARWFAIYAPSVYPTRLMVVVDFYHTIVEVLSLSFFPSILFLLYFFPKSVTLFTIMLPINTESTRSPGIRALCSQLGYYEAKESPRHYTCLATPLRQFRSLNKAYEVPRCALEFCERNEKDKHFFTSSHEARRNGWPVLLDDKDRYCTPYVLLLLFPW